MITFRCRRRKFVSSCFYTLGRCELILVLCVQQASRTHWILVTVVSDRKLIKVVSSGDYDPADLITTITRGSESSFVFHTSLASRNIGWMVFEMILFKLLAKLNTSWVPPQPSAPSSPRLRPRVAYPSLLHSPSRVTYPSLPPS